MQKTLAELCTYVQGKLIGDGATVIRGLNSCDAAGKDELTYAESPQRLTQALASSAGAILFASGELQGRAGIQVANPKLAFARLLRLFYPQELGSAGVHSTAVLGKDVELGEGAGVGPHAIVGDGTRIGKDSRIGPGAYVGANVTIGDGTVIDPNVVVYDGTVIGSRVRIHGGSVIAGDGFGYVMDQGKYVKVPQIGNVVIEDDVEIGCNVCVDRATLGTTRVGQGSKIDNQVQIAHNNVIGKHVILSGQVGLAGTVEVGDYSILGGKTGVVDHVKIGKKVRSGGGTVIIGDIREGETIWGFPARPVQMVKQQMAALARLPKLLKQLIGLSDRSKRNKEREKVGQGSAK